MSPSDSLTHIYIYNVTYAIHMCVCICLRTYMLYIIQFCACPRKVKPQQKQICLGELRSRLSLVKQLSCPEEVSD